MTTLLLNIRDDRKVEDVLRFLRDIDFLDVQVKDDSAKLKNRVTRRIPAKEIFGTRIVGDIMTPVISDTDWKVLDESAS